MAGYSAQLAFNDFNEHQSRELAVNEIVGSKVVGSKVVGNDILNL